MYSLLHRASRCSSVARTSLRLHPPSHRISTTPAWRSKAAPEPPTVEEEAELEINSPEVLDESDPEFDEDFLADFEEENTGPPESYKEFLDRVGSQYKVAKPRNWIGGEVPFPMNPTFKPPPPLSDSARQQIYLEYLQDPLENSVRALSQRYHLSLKRVDAILRLKGLEHAWEKGKQIQHGFQKGMERLLDVQQHKLEKPVKDSGRWDVAEADSLEQDENRDAQRQRYQRHYWESVPEDGREPVVPGSLEHAKEYAQKMVKLKERQTSAHPRLMPHFPDTKYVKTPKQKVQVLEKVGRPTLKIQDVGAKFLNLNEALKRISVADRRTREKCKKRKQVAGARSRVRNAQQAA